MFSPKSPIINSLLIQLQKFHITTAHVHKQVYIHYHGAADIDDKFKSLAVCQEGIPNLNDIYKVCRGISNSTM